MIQESLATADLSNSDSSEPRYDRKAKTKSGVKTDKTSLLDKGIQLAASLDRANKLALIRAIEAMLEAEDDQMDESELRIQHREDAKSRSGSGRGRFEPKMIPRNGKHYGPYLYFRWWLGEIYKSTYIGKCPPS